MTKEVVIEEIKKQLFKAVEVKERLEIKLGVIGWWVEELERIYLEEEKEIE